MKQFDELAHAFFEPGDKDYWDGIELAKGFIKDMNDCLPCKICGTESMYMTRDSEWLCLRCTKAEIHNEKKSN